MNKYKFSFKLNSRLDDKSENIGLHKSAPPPQKSSKNLTQTKSKYPTKRDEYIRHVKKLIDDLVSIFLIFFLIQSLALPELIHYG